jgi:hypothetical protein
MLIRSLVPGAGIEPARLAAGDFEFSCYTKSADLYCLDAYNYYVHYFVLRA